MLKDAPVFDGVRSMHRRLTSDDLRASGHAGGFTRIRRLTSCGSRLRD